MALPIKAQRPIDDPAALGKAVHGQSRFFKGVKVKGIMAGTLFHHRKIARYLTANNTQAHLCCNTALGRRYVGGKKEQRH
ncbi:MAG: hypothetical protein HUK40_04425 [Desulfobacter sp.]|nr:hypothetical protein [Desulfobacter sp.]WDP87568.1 MAG: hypothetical protein HUN05_22590 [Desulfobacter sp.]